ncbi:MAG: ATP-dependent Clp protease adaptor ClpS [Fimbriimonadales bacterium]|nr:ATP-dependent Clp protease adaptor ClpS [Fimbriimonadales bacterium]
MGGLKVRGAAGTHPGLEERTDSGQGSGGGEWIVTVYDNDHNTFEEVILVLMVATGCSLREAQIETWEIHHLGKSVVHHASKEECDRVASVISTIGIRVEVTQE